MGITSDKQIRLMVIELVENSVLQNKRYSIFYNKDNDYLKVKEKRISKEEAEIDNVLAKDFLTTLDSFKNEIKFPEGDYKYYNIKLLSAGNITMDNSEDNEIYVIDDNGVYKLKDKDVQGLCFYVYGEPLQKGDRPIFYVIKN
ncbi:hypothetical protein [Caldisalinibacter kiritimatiensis]|uniref:Uncharacterized protein n=1 Tax=Caldisalinibacter kiritimatiensis TaxID=1304284 RepID=R1AQ68_9FIRM|nr:hypothetical protein [Caldisalinibacter kiritimatiensis]EOC99272.1 hypothetical protein L21TH_2736 [Caldisalinibacter kiritimatiensis]